MSDERPPIPDGKLIGYAGESVMVRRDPQAEKEVRKQIADSLDFSNLPIVPDWDSQFPR